MGVEAINLYADMKSTKFVLLNLQDDIIDRRAATEHLTDTVHGTKYLTVCLRLKNTS